MDITTTNPVFDGPSVCATTARLLSATASAAGALGGGSALLAAALLMWGAPAVAASTAATLLLLLVAGTAAVERVLALRLRLDAGLFADLAYGTVYRSAAGSASGNPCDSGYGIAGPRSLRRLDRALHKLGLRAQPSTCRPLADRVQGARRLVMWHLAVAAAQGAGIGATLVLLALSPITGQLAP